MERISIVHGSDGGYGLILRGRIVAGDPRGILKYEKELPVDTEELAIAVSQIPLQKVKEQSWQLVEKLVGTSTTSTAKARISGYQGSRLSRRQPSPLE